MKDNKKKSMFIMLLSIVGILSLTIGVSIAFFNYTRTGSPNTMATGRIYFYSEQNNTLNITNVFPLTSTQAASANLDSVTLTITGDTTYTDGEEFLISIVDVNNTVNNKQIPLNYTATYVANTNGNIGTSSNDYFNAREAKNASIYKLNSTGEVKENKQILVGYIDNGATGVNGTLTIKAYVDGARIAISDTYDGNETDNMGTTSDWVAGRTVLTTEEWNYFQGNHSISFKIRAESNEGIWVEDTNALAKVQKSITAKINATTNSCNPIWVDDMGTANDESDDITYFSGTNECVDMNYVWYSGKLWRITAIYPDGSMKMVTEDALTAIYWGRTVEYNGSRVYQWLNEDFYDTLVNSSDILISDATWNYSTNGNSTPVRPESIATQKTKEAPIGLLNAYEYYNAYRNATTSTNYLNIGYNWWLITPYNNNSGVSDVGSSGTYHRDSSSNREMYGVRPSINLKSGIEFTGNGTINSPYKVVGDKGNPVSGALVSSRSVGEYVKFDNDIYRIVSIDETTGTTKLTKVDYLRDNGIVITKNFASTVYFGKSTNTQSDTYWDYYLNNTWYNSISGTYKDMLVDGTYYLGLYAESSKNYKITICKDTASTLDNITTKNCTKYTSEDTDKTFTGKVGLPRVGEMFSSQLGSGYSSSSNMWTITPYSTSDVRFVDNYGKLYFDGKLNGHSPTSYTDAVRPSITLKSGIRITGGTGYVGGDINSPFEISE